MSDIFSDSTILVTGGTGSIGSAIVRELLTLAPRAVRIFSRSEEKQFWMKRELLGRQVRFLLGDIRDRERLSEAMCGVDYVFHCAALKHVDMCEYNPQEAVSVNATGTVNVLHAATAAGVKALLHLSTDKVANPNCVMAWTKGVAESAAKTHWRWNDHPRVVIVRLGNVLYSSGSLGAVISECVQKGQAYPLVNREMSRYFISAPTAAAFIVRALLDGKSGEVWIPPMDERKVRDVARMMAAEAAKCYGKDYDPDNCVLCEPKAGENVRESLWTDSELLRIENRGDACIIPVL